MASRSPPRDLLFVLNCRDVDLPQLFALTSTGAKMWSACGGGQVCQADVGVFF